mgnify:CR=1 FL=1
MTKHSKHLKSALKGLMDANQLIMTKTDVMRKGNEQDLMLALAGVMAATLLAAGANIATLVLLEAEYND